MNVKMPRILNPSTMGYGSRLLHPLKISYSNELTPPSTAKITLGNGEDLSIREWVEIFDGNGSIGKFRVTASDRDVTGETQVTLTHGFGALYDAVVKGEGKLTGNLGQLLSQLLTHQTAMAGSTKLWELGTAATSESKTVKFNNDNLLDKIRDVLDMYPDHMLTFDQSKLPWKVNVIALSNNDSAEGRFSRNMNGVMISVDDDDLCTRVFSDDGEKSVDADTLSQYGVISRVLSVSSGATDKEEDDLLQEYISLHKDPTVSIDIDALDLFAVTGEIWDAPEIGKKYRCVVPEYNLVVSNRIVTATYDDLLSDPSKVHLTLANRKKKLEDILADQNRRMGGYGQRINNNEENFIELYDEYTHFAETTEETFNQVWVDLNGKAGTLELRALSENYEQYKNDVSIVLDAMNAEIALKASHTDFEGLENSVSLELDAMNAEISLKASHTDLQGLENEVSIKLDAVENQITLKADKIDLQGYVTASQLQATNASISNITSGLTTATVLKAMLFSGDTVNVTAVDTSILNHGGKLISKRSMEVTTPSGTQTIYYMGYVP